MQRVMEAMQRAFGTGYEYTLEAGRPDTITKEKLGIAKMYGVNRLCINPQTMQNKTLERIGRRHTAEDIEACWLCIGKARRLYTYQCRPNCRPSGRNGRGFCRYAEKGRAPGSSIANLPYIGIEERKQSSQRIIMRMGMRTRYRAWWIWPVKSSGDGHGAVLFVSSKSIWPAI